MDDIVGMGGKEIVEHLGEKMRTLEITKNLCLSTIKTKQKYSS